MMAMSVNRRIERNLPAVMGQRDPEAMIRVRSTDPIRASGLVPRQQAGHMTASDLMGQSVKRTLARRGPSTHDGSMSTVHANTTRDAVTRIENMVQMGNMGLPSRSIRTQIVGAVDLIIQVERHRDGKRRVTQVTDVCGLEGETVILNDIFAFQVEGESVAGGLVGRYRVNRARPSFHQRLSYFGLDRAWATALEEAEP